MDIVLHMPVVITSDRNVTVALTDGGKAQVALTLSISDGTLFSSAGGATTPPDTVLAPGAHVCTAVIAAGNHGAFGSNYDSRIEVAGQLVATAQGTLDAGTSDLGQQLFQLVVAS